MNQPKPRYNNSFIKQCAMVFHLYLLDSKEIKPVNPKGNKPRIFIGRTDAEAEAPILWPPDAKSQLIGKDLDAGKEWGQEEKGVTEDEMVGWHDWLNGHELSKLWDIVKDREAWCAAVQGVPYSWASQNQISKHPPNKEFLLYRTQGSRPSPWKRNAKRQNGCLRRSYK